MLAIEHSMDLALWVSAVALCLTCLGCQIYGAYSRWSFRKDMEKCGLWKKGDGNRL